MTLAVQTELFPRLTVLDRLIASRWGDWPASRIPADVLGHAETGKLPRRAPLVKPRKCSRIEDAARPKGRLRMWAFRRGALARCNDLPIEQIPAWKQHWRPAMTISWRAGWLQVDREIHRLTAAARGKR